MKKMTILLLSAAYANGGAYVDAGNTVPIGDGAHEITHERAVDIENGMRGEISEVEDDAEVEEAEDEGDGLDTFTVSELKKYAVDQNIDLGDAKTKKDILVVLRAPRD